MVLAGLHMTGWNVIYTCTIEKLRKQHISFDGHSSDLLHISWGFPQ